MDLLEHPFETVAFRLYSLPEASAATGAAAWTCLAAVLAAAAAAGLWRLRSSTPTAVAASTKPSELEPSPVVEPSTEPSRPSQRSPPATASSSSSTAAAAAAAASLPKERYTAYYRDAGCVGCCCDVCDEDDEEENDDGDAEEHEDGDRGVFRADEADPFGWEVVRSLPLSPTAAEMAGRYRRSPTALSGRSVVQLWDQGGLTPTASPRRRGRVVVGGVPNF